mmetsp:Transcript_39781/g.97767  ORF Transcript_39781/g.97767 Transcript_39781/m.97767 type:complete len:214 (-) Transcript_39781:125-766(-)
MKKILKVIEKKKKKPTQGELFFEDLKKKKMLFFFTFFSFPGFSVIADDDLKNKKAFSTKSGLKILEFTEGEGKAPEWGNLLVINYVIYELTPKGLDQIDSTFGRNQPFLFAHGGGQVIRGIEETVHDMKMGGKRRVILSEETGYVNPTLGPVPPLNYQRKKLFEKNKNEFLENKKLIVFDIELVDIKKNIHTLGNFSNFFLNNTEIRNLFLSE